MCGCPFTPSSASNTLPLSLPLIAQNCTELPNIARLTRNANYNGTTGIKCYVSGKKAYKIQSNLHRNATHNRLVRGSNPSGPTTS